VIRRDFETFTGNEEEHVLVFAEHLDVGLITGTDVLDGPFMLQVEAVTVPGGTGSIIEYRLMRDLDTEDLSEDRRRLSGRDSKRDIEGQDQAEDILAVMDSGQFDQGLVRRRVLKFIGSEMILPVLVSELKLGTLHLHQFPFRRIEFGDGLEAMRALVVRALMDGHFLVLLPAKESPTAIRAKELRLFAGSESLLHLKQKSADLTEDL